MENQLSQEQNTLTPDLNLYFNRVLGILDSELKNQTIEKYEKIFLLDQYLPAAHPLLVDVVSKQEITKIVGDLSFGNDIWEQFSQSTRSILQRRIDNIRFWLNAFSENIYDQSICNQLSTNHDEELVSIVVASRNDNHGGDLHQRTKLFFDSLIEKSARFKRKIEVILVEWNPPKENPRIWETLNLENKSEFLSVRIVEVPEKLHNELFHGSSYPLYQMPAKNVGIRKARGRFVLCTNIDIVFSDELFRKLDPNQLKAGHIYRADRHDLERDAFKHESTDHLNEYELRKLTHRVNHKTGWYSTKSTKREDWAPSASFSKNRIQNLHTNACGDFQMMARQDWESIGGYPEWDMYSMHIDSVLEHTACRFDLAETIFEGNCCTFHVDHDNGWTPESGADGSFDQRYKHSGTLKIPYESLAGLIFIMERLDRVIYFNKPNWGMIDFSLSEKSAMRAEWEQVTEFDTNECERKNSQSVLNSRIPNNFPKELSVQPSELLNEHKQRIPVYIDELEQRLKENPNLKIYFWGASNAGKFYLDELNKRQNEQIPHAFIDSDTAKHDTFFEGKPVLAPSVLQSTQLNLVKITTASYTAVQEQLETLGLRSMEDYF